MRKEYANVAIPKELADEIDTVVAKNKLGYTSRAQFVIEAVRERLLKLRFTIYQCLIHIFSYIFALLIA
jgi:metal-responsive CopG/Arc/MetJ family transcriptional regulator